MKFGMPTLVECKDIFECCDVAEKYGLDVLDLFSVAERVKEHLKPDGVHFMPVGYEAFAEALVECAKNILSDT